MSVTPPTAVDDHGRAAEAPGAQVLQRVVGALERVLGDLGAHRHPRGHGEELLAVGSGQVGDRAQHALLIELSYGNDGMSLMWIPAHTTDAGAVGRPQRRRDQLPDGGEDERRVEWLGRRAEGVACPFRAELARERLRVGIAAPREGEHPPPLRHRRFPVLLIIPVLTGKYTVRGGGSLRLANFASSDTPTTRQETA